MVGRRMVPGGCDLLSLFPDIAKQAYGWDPSTVFPASNQKLQWRCVRNHLYLTTPNKKTSRGDGCPICSNRQLLVGFNDLTTTHPDVAASADGWDPETVVGGCNDKKPWKCHHGHTWLSSVNDRTQGKGCPYCAGRLVWPGFNDLASQMPDLAKEAHGWDPRNVHVGSNKKLEWKCAAEGHVFIAPVSDRAGDGKQRLPTGCPYCTNRMVFPGFNDLATHYPDLAKEADGWDPTQVLSGTHKKLRWKCRLGHTWSVSVITRTAAARSGLSCGCPKCGNRKVEPGFNDLLTQAPDIAKEADGWDPAMVTVGSVEKKSWQCTLGHKWQSSVRSRVLGNHGCPVCANRVLLKGFNDLATVFPELANEADGWDPAKVLRGSATRKTWICSKGHRWSAVVALRARGNGCPECAAYGFNKGKPSWFYLMQRPGEQQLGITNDIKARMAHHHHYGWEEIEVVGPHPGDEVLNLETEFRRWLASEIGVVPGTKENWMTTRLEVRSLAHLKEISGIATNLF